MGNTNKQREREIKWIQKQLKRKKMKEWPEVHDLLAELQLCYIAGANKAVYLLAGCLVERYLARMFFMGEGELLQYTAEREGGIFHTDEKSQIEVQRLRNERSQAFDILNDGMHLIGAVESGQKRKISKKRTRALMKQVEQFISL